MAVPDAGIPHQVFEATRAAVVGKVPLSGAGDRRFCELSGGILRYGGCGLRLQAHVVTSRGRAITTCAARSTSGRPRRSAR
ncbi:MAG: hypothetical protein M3N33_10395 [Actinomycetota bacterium]|nr:hypothetical protein [Actinomycetota bacterium]